MNPSRIPATHSIPLLLPRWWICCLLTLAPHAPRPSLAAGGPENLFLVVNAGSPDSLAIADEYVALRNIPPSNVLRLDGIPSTPVIKADEFRSCVLRPILDAIQQRGLKDQIDYVVYSAGFPYAVDVSVDIGGRKLPMFATQPASLTGFTYLYELALEGKAEDYLALNSNWYMRRVKKQKPDTAWTEADRQKQTDLMELFHKCEDARKKAAEAKTPMTPDMQRWLEEAVTLSHALMAAHPSNPELLYNLACVLALQGKPDEAMASLAAAFDSGWWNAELTQADTDLASLRERQDFKSLLEKMRQVVIETEPPRPFHSATTWKEDGVAGEGRRYLLSAMLACTGGPANTLDEALAALRQSVAADGTAPTGTIYFMVSSDWARTGPRQWAFKSAAEALGKLGVKTEVLPGVLPKDRPDVAGAMIGIAGFSWKDCGSRILPGAFCDHLTSFGGVMQGAGQTLLSEFLRHGAAGACGTVTEPYNVPSKFPSPFLHVFYASGCSLAEAFYQSVYGPYQQLLVGDPLCQPWAKFPVVQVKGLKAGETVSKPRRLLPTAQGAQPVTRFELFVDGRRVQTVPPGKSLTLNPTGLAEGDHEVRVVAVAGPLETQGRVIVPFRIRRWKKARVDANP